MSIQCSCSCHNPGEAQCGLPLIPLLQRKKQLSVLELCYFPASRGFQQSSSQCCHFFFVPFYPHNGSSSSAALAGGEYPASAPLRSQHVLSLSLLCEGEGAASPAWRSLQSSFCFAAKLDFYLGLALAKCHGKGSLIFFVVCSIFANFSILGMKSISATL